jgi:hypothetical protein
MLCRTRRSAGAAAPLGEDDVAVSEAEREQTSAWGRTAFLAGVISAVGLFLQTALFFLDATGTLPFSPDYHETGAGRGEDLATYYVALFERQHDIVWDVALRDTIGPVAALALMVLALALVRLRGHGRPGPAVWGLVFAIGALLKLLSDVVFLSQLAVYLDSGFTPEFPADIVAVGRASEAVDALSSYLESVAYLVLAAALLGLAGLLGRRLSALARVVALALAVSVLAWVAGWWPVMAVAEALAGIVLAPALLIGLGRSLARDDARAADAPVS